MGPALRLIPGLILGLILDLILHSRLVLYMYTTFNAISPNFSYNPIAYPPHIRDWKSKNGINSTNLEYFPLQ